MPLNEAQRFERETAMHETRGKGIANLLTSPSWMRYADRVTQLRTREEVAVCVQVTEPTVVVVGVGGGGLYEWLWRDGQSTRIGIDLNHSVLVNAIASHGQQFFAPVEGDAGRLPFADGSVDVVAFDFVLHHLVGQGALESSLSEANRILKPGGYILAREPSSYSPSGMLLNVMNRYRLMHAVSGASNYEFALSPRALTAALEQFGPVLRMRGLTYLFAHCLPVWAQRLIGVGDRLWSRSERAQWFADFILYISQKRATVTG
jgi:demethylmenaquinone methyltransferase/2-methoxy-6-polyprenyl-1,4-benzoquinol methylase